MGRPTDTDHVLTFLLVALLAWPWNVALSAAEFSQSTTQSRFESARFSGGSGLRNLVRIGRSSHAGSPVIAPDYDRDEEMEDGGGVSSLSPVPAPARVVAGVVPWAHAVLFAVTPIGAVPREARCRLRC